MGGLLVINPRAGDAEPSPEALRDEAQRRSLDTHLLSPGEDPAEVARAASAQALGMAGGDGSLGPVAEVALERDVPLSSSRSVHETTSRVTSGSTATIRLPPSMPSRAGKPASTWAG